MKPWQQWVVILGLVAVGFLIGYGLATRPGDCASLKAHYEASSRAAEICTAELVGCTMRFDEVRGVVIARVAAEEACK